MLWTCSRDGHSGTLQGHWHWVDCRRAAFVRFWVADRSDSWVVAFLPAPGMFIFTKRFSVTPTRNHDHPQLVGITPIDDRVKGVS